MGTSHTDSQQRNMLQLLLASSLLALASAEADPQLLYGGLGLPYAAGPAVLAPVGAVAHPPVVKSVVDKPAEVSHEVTAHTVAVGYHGLGHFGYYGKRSADAEPAVLAGASRVLTPPTPLIHNPPVLPVAYAAHPVAYAGYAAHPLGYAGLPYAGLPHLAAPIVAPAVAAPAVDAERKKREADPQLLYGAGLPYAAAAAVAPIGFAPVGAVAHAPVVKSVVEKPAEVAHEVTAHAVPVAVGYGYHGLPYWG